MPTQWPRYPSILAILVSKPTPAWAKDLHLSNSHPKTPKPTSKAGCPGWKCRLELSHENPREHQGRGGDAMTNWARAKKKEKNGGISLVLDHRRWRRDIFHSVSKPRSRCTRYGLAFLPSWSWASASLRSATSFQMLPLLYKGNGSHRGRGAWGKWMVGGTGTWPWKSRSSPAEPSQWLLLSLCRSGPTQWPCDPCNLLAQ